ncbi:MAG: hypothetical protein QOI07_1 [Verrucomicrobiota bacterium]|jgi:hypothetical protein
MSALLKSVVTLRISGDALLPAEISELLGAQPTHGVAKGDETVGEQTGTRRIAKSGMWRLCAADREPEDIDAQIQELLSQLTSDLTVWREIATRYQIDLFCGLFMGDTNDGLILSPASLVALGQRHIELQLDIYDAHR